MSFYCNITLSFYPNIARQNCSSDEGLRQACQTGGPIACPMRPAAILIKHKVAQNDIYFDIF